LKSGGATPRSCRYRPAGESALMDPAGEMWSVGMESPTITRHRAPRIGRIDGAVRVISAKNGGS